jgi:hypothetical protein
VTRLILEKKVRDSSRRLLRIKVFHHIGGQRFFETRMGFDQSQNVGQIFLPLAGTTFTVTPRGDFSLQRVFQTGDAHENTVNVRRHGALRKFPVKFLRADLHATLKQPLRFTDHAKRFALKPAFFKASTASATRPAAMTKSTSAVAIGSSAQ